MTLKELQEFLDAEKWKDSEAHACDMCGRYARCRYCVRTEDEPCAMAHNRLIAATNAPVPDRIPDWLLPEPKIPAQPEVDRAPSAVAGQSSEEVIAEPPASGQNSPAAVEAAALRAPRVLPHVIVRGVKGEVRLCTLQKRIPTVSSELGN